MGKDLNKVMLTGHLGADPEMRYTPQGSAVTTFRVASGREWKNGDGAKQQETEWFRVVAWNKLAEICNQYLVKGSHVYIEGRLQTRSWQGDDGQTHYMTEVVAQDMMMLGGRPGGAADEYTPETEADAPAQAAARRDALRSAGTGERPIPPPARTNPAEAMTRGRPAPARPARKDEEDLPF